MRTVKAGPYVVQQRGAQVEPVRHLAAAGRARAAVMSQTGNHPRPVVRHVAVNRVRESADILRAAILHQHAVVDAHLVEGGGVVRPGVLALRHVGGHMNLRQPLVVLAQARREAALPGQLVVRYRVGVAEVGVAHGQVGRRPAEHGPALVLPPADGPADADRATRPERHDVLADRIHLRRPANSINATIPFTERHGGHVGRVVPAPLVLLLLRPVLRRPGHVAPPFLQFVLRTLHRRGFGARPAMRTGKIVPGV